MIQLSVTNFLIYFTLVWMTNICLNFLYVIKRYIPKFKNFDRPLDGGLKYKNDRLLGESTTVIGLIVSFLISFLLYFITLNFIWTIIPILVYVGHLLGSFIKRRVHKKDGEFMPFIDHGDYVIFTSIIFVLLDYISVLFAFLVIIVTYILHPIACFLAFKLKLREYPY
jgi:uncharacterized protein YacL